MSKLSKREVFELCQSSGLPDSVMYVHGSAGDNAADTIGGENRHDANGQFTDEFIGHWFRSVQCILCSSDGCEQEACDWFEAHGVSY